MLALTSGLAPEKFRDLGTASAALADVALSQIARGFPRRQTPHLSLLEASRKRVHDAIIPGLENLEICLVPLELLLHEDQSHRLASFVFMAPATVVYVYAGWAGGEAIAGEGTLSQTAIRVLVALTALGVLAVLPQLAVRFARNRRALRR